MVVPSEIGSLHTVTARSVVGVKPLPATVTESFGAAVIDPVSEGTCVTDPPVDTVVDVDDEVVDEPLVDVVAPVAVVLVVADAEQAAGVVVLLPAAVVDVVLDPLLGAVDVVDDVDGGPPGRAVVDDELVAAGRVVVVVEDDVGAASAKVIGVNALGWVKSL